MTLTSRVLLAALITFTLLLAGTLTGCPNPPPPVDPPTGENCAGAYHRLLDCETQGFGDKLSIRTKKGETYEQVCLRVEKEGKIPTGATCITKAPNCEEVVACQQ